MPAVRTVTPDPVVRVLERRRADLAAGRMRGDPTLSAMRGASAHVVLALNRARSVRRLDECSALGRREYEANAREAGAVHATLRVLH